MPCGCTCVTNLSDNVAVATLPGSAPPVSPAAACIPAFYIASTRRTYFRLPRFVRDDASTLAACSLLFIGSAVHRLLLPRQVAWQRVWFGFDLVLMRPSFAFSVLLVRATFVASLTFCNCALRVRQRGVVFAVATARNGFLCCAHGVTRSWFVKNITWPFTFLQLCGFTTWQPASRHITAVAYKRQHSCACSSRRYWFGSRRWLCVLAHCARSCWLLPSRASWFGSRRFALSANAGSTTSSRRERTRCAFALTRFSERVLIIRGWIGETIRFSVSPLARSLITTRPWTTCNAH